MSPLEARTRLVESRALTWPRRTHPSASRFLFRDTGLSSSDTGDTGPGRRLRARPRVAPPAADRCLLLAPSTPLTPSPHEPLTPPGLTGKLHSPHTTIRLRPSRVRSKVVEMGDDKYTTGKGGRLQIELVNVSREYNQLKEKHTFQ